MTSSVYCAVASVVPVWSLFQPRGYLGGFVLYTAILVGIIGVLFGGYEVCSRRSRDSTSAASPGPCFHSCS